MSRRWTNQLLNTLRDIGDPWMEHGRNFDAVKQEYPSDKTAPGQAPGGASSAEFRRLRRPPENKAPSDPAFWKSGSDNDPAHYWHAGLDWRDRLDPEDVEIAQYLFIRYGQEIGAALLLASLPQSYAVEAGAQILDSSEQLESNPRRRILATSEFLLKVMLEEDKPRLETVEALRNNVYDKDPRLSLLPGGAGYRAARHTRVLHAQIRQQLQSTSSTAVPSQAEQRSEDHVSISNGAVINQEFLIGTYLSFCVTVWESLERLGIRWTTEEKQAYLNVWDWVAHLMGIGTEAVAEEVASQGIAVRRFRDEGRERILRPTTVREAEYVMDLIRDRNWPAREETTPFQNASGKKLVSTLLVELEDAMPTLVQSLPLTVMRYLADDRVTVALGLGGGGLPPVLLDWTQGYNRARAKRTNPRLASVMRAAANQVSLHAYTNFMRTGPFTFPGMVGSQSTMVRGRSKKPGADALSATETRSAN